MLGEYLLPLAFIVLLVSSVSVIRRLEEPESPWIERLHSRLLYGVPWGTLIVVTLVLAFYLIGQDGITNFSDPVSIPFRAWSYFYPLGLVTSSFAHIDGGHITGNLLSTLVIAPIAEYAWGHYGSATDDRVWDRPVVRACVVFPFAVFGTGLVLSLVEIGPVIGFSVLVYAFAGFAIVRYPIATLIATIGGQGAISIAYRALENPIYIYTVSPGGPSPPGWSQIAIQGHAIGFLAGVVLAILVFSRRDWRPSPGRLWVAVLLFATAKSLWAIYWYGDPGTFILYRGLGVVAVLLFALIITAAVTAGYRSTDRDDRRSAPGRLGPLANRRRVALAAFVLMVALVAMPAIPTNLFVPEGGGPDDGSLTVDDYTIRYAEGVENELVSFVDLSALGLDTSTQASGVIVTSEKRHIWWEERSASQLAHRGGVTIYVGGLANREAVHVRRTGWSPVGNSTVYQVHLSHEETQVLGYESPSRQVHGIFAGATLSIATQNGSFQLVVDAPSGQTSVEIPSSNGTVTAGRLTFERSDAMLYAISDDTAVPIARRV